MIIEIDGMQCECDEGDTLLEVARANGIFVPTLCESASFGTQAACRLCCVEVASSAVGAGWSDPKMVCACEMLVQDGQRVRTRSERIDSHRRTTLALLAARAGDEALGWIGEMCVRLGECAEGLPIYEIADEQDARLAGCVMCGLCVRACAKTGKNALAFVGRSVERHVVRPAVDGQTPCDDCGLCERVCPTGAARRIPRT